MVPVESCHSPVGPFQSFPLQMIAAHTTTTNMLRQNAGAPPSKKVSTLQPHNNQLRINKIPAIFFISVLSFVAGSVSLPV